MNKKVLSLLVTSIILAGCNNGSEKPEYVPDPDPVPGEPGTGEPTPGTPKPDRVDVIPLVADIDGGTGAINPINTTINNFYNTGDADGGQFEDELCLSANAPVHCSIDGDKVHNKLLSLPVLPEEVTVYSHLQDFDKFRTVTYEFSNGIDSYLPADHTMLSHVFDELTRDSDVNDGFTRLTELLGLTSGDEFTTVADLGSEHVNALIALEYINYRDNGDNPELLSSDDYDNFPSDALDSYESLNRAVNIAVSEYDINNISTLITTANTIYSGDDEVYVEISENEELGTIFPSPESLEAVANSYARLLEHGSFFVNQNPILELKGNRRNATGDIPEHYVTTKYIDVGIFTDSAQVNGDDYMLTHGMTQNYLAQYALLNSIYDWNEDWGANFSIEDLRDGMYRGLYHGFAQYYANQNFTDPVNNADNKCNPLASEEGDCVFPDNYGSYGLLYEVLMSGSGGTPSEANDTLKGFIGNLKTYAYNDCQETPVGSESQAEACIRAAFDASGFIDTQGNPLTVADIQSNWLDIVGDYVASGHTSDSQGQGNM